MRLISNAESIEKRTPSRCRMESYRYTAVLFYSRPSFLRTFLYDLKSISASTRPSKLRLPFLFEGVRNAEHGVPAGGQNTKCQVPSLRLKFSI